ncbi:MAG: hypothetical protein AAFR61_24615 [Bacteroidota bacterium]
MKNLVPFLILLLLAGAVACVSSSPKEGVLSADEPITISPPRTDLAPGFQTYTLNSEEDQQIKVASGTVIDIPAGSFVTQDGQTVTGPVQIKYREYHTAWDVLLSGIPMHAQNGDQRGWFQTAGMMEIQGFQNEQEIMIAPGKALQVAMASYVGAASGQDSAVSDGYNLYQLDENNQWQNLQPALAVAKAQEEVTEIEIPKRPVRPRKVQNPDRLFKLAVNKRKFPELSVYQDVSWEVGNILEGDQRFKDNPELIFGQMWDNASIVRARQDQSNYRLQVQNGQFTLKMEAVPVFEAGSYQQAMAAFEAKEAEIAQLMVLREQEMARVEAEASLVRSFSISSFGTYNCDRFYRVTPAQQVIADFSFGTEENPYAEIDKVYLVIPDQQAVITYQKNSGWNGWKNLKFSPSERNYLLAMLPNKEVAVFGPEDFASADIGESYTFAMRASGQQVNSAEELLALVK